VGNTGENLENAGQKKVGHDVETGSRMATYHTPLKKEANDRRLNSFPKKASCKKDGGEVAGTAVAIT